MNTLLREEETIIRAQGVNTRQGNRTHSVFVGTAQNSSYCPSSAFCFSQPHPLLLHGGAHFCPRCAPQLDLLSSSQSLLALSPGQLGLRAAGLTYACLLQSPARGTHFRKCSCFSSLSPLPFVSLSIFLCGDRFICSCNSHDTACAGNLGVLMASEILAEGLFQERPSCLVFSPSCHIPRPEGSPALVTALGPQSQYPWVVTQRALGPRSGALVSTCPRLTAANLPWSPCDLKSLLRRVFLRELPVQTGNHFPALPQSVLTKPLLEINDVMV